MEAGSAELGTAVSIPTDVTVTVTAAVSVPRWTAPPGAAPGEQQAFDTAKAGLEKHEQEHVEIAKQGGQALEEKVMNSVGAGQGQTQGQAKANAKADLARKAETAQRQQRATTSRKQKDYDKKTGHGK
jgi:predicted secreted Zn-dependent protease